MYTTYMSTNKKEGGKATNLETVDVDNNSNVSGANPPVSNGRKVEWSEENEMIMVEWCDVAQCYKWLNTQANSKYSYMHAWFTIPAIILSTISGTASFAQSSLPANVQAFAPSAIGSLNIFIGILTTVQQYLKISELNEAHRVASISWDKFARNIRIELAKRPSERMDAGTFLKICRQEFDRLMETSPMVPADIVAKFTSTFQGKPGSQERLRFDKLKKPDICNILISADETRHQWTKDEMKIPDLDNHSMDFEMEVMGKDETIKQLQGTIRKKQLEEQRKKLEAQKEEEDRTSYLKDLEEKTRARYDKQSKTLSEFVGTFTDNWGRAPLTDEIVGHAQELADQIDEDMLQKYLETYTLQVNDKV